MSSSDTEPEDAVRVRGTADDDSEIVLQQLDRILASRFFSSTKRYSGLLRYLVESSLEGRSDTLKERTIGVDVFGRPPDYDSNADHVVRTAAGEIRKRLAQYYLEPDRETELRIEVPPGAYVPYFRKPAEIPVAAAITTQEAARPEALVFGRRVSLALLIPAVLITAVLTALGTALVGKLHSRDAVDRFWTPLTASDRPILLCVGDTSRRPLGTPAPDADSESTAPPDVWTLRDYARLHAPRVFASDAVTLARLAGTIQPRHNDVRILPQSETTLEDLRGTPAVLIGLRTNEWTIRLTGKERFSTVQTSPASLAIRDREHPARTDWSVDLSTPYLQLNKDYAIVSRIRNPTTEQVVVLVGGIFTFGSVGAAEFLSNPEYLKKLESYAPPDWDWKNLEFVLSVDVIAGKSGVPRILAAHFW